jgi:hypothetical protein
VTLPGPLATRSGESIELLNPSTGEVIPLDASTEQLAEWLDQTKEWEARLRDAKRLAQGELLRRLDANARWTDLVGEFEIRAPSPSPKVVYDNDELAKTLTDLVAEGLITEEAKDAALELATYWKPKIGGIKKLLKLGGEVKDRVEACGQVESVTRYVSVKRKGAPS